MDLETTTLWLDSRSHCVCHLWKRRPCRRSSRHGSNKGCTPSYNERDSDDELALEFESLKFPCDFKNHASTKFLPGSSQTQKPRGENPRDKPNLRNPKLSKEEMAIASIKNIENHAHHSPFVAIHVPNSLLAQRSVLPIPILITLSQFRGMQRASEIA